MTLNKKAMVREIGRRTRLKNRDVQHVIETLVEVWTEELVSGGRIEIENFVVIEVSAIRGREPHSALFKNDQEVVRYLRYIVFRVSKKLRRELNARFD